MDQCIKWHDSWEVHFSNAMLLFSIDVSRIYELLLIKITINNAKRNIAEINIQESIRINSKFCSSKF